MRLKAGLFVFALVLLSAQAAFCHFGMVIPTTDVVTQEKKNISVDLAFAHPFEMHGMELVKPEKFYLAKEGKVVDLLDSLAETKLMSHKAWQSSYTFKRPGVYTLVMEPVPYWEPVEDLSIIHYTKTVLSVFGDDAGWDEPVGLPTEIVPLLRPFGNYAGNTFTGKVLMAGKPVAGAEVEVELYNSDKKYIEPSDLHITQVVKADEDGVFSFTCPKAGWWGFAALNEADYTIKDPQGNDKGVELGAVMWVYFNEYMTR